MLRYGSLININPSDSFELLRKTDVPVCSAEPLKLVSHPINIGLFEKNQKERNFENAQKNTRLYFIFPFPYNLEQ